MPRKEKKAAADSSSAVGRTLDSVSQPQHHLGDRNAPPPQAWHKPGGNAGGQAEPPIASTLDEAAKMKELRYLQEMFAKKLDPVVVHMIMEDSDYKVDVALETLFKLAEDSQPRDDDDEQLSFKNVVPTAESSIDRQEAWGAALPGRDGASAALPIARVLSQRRNSDDGYPALPSQVLDTSQGIPPGLASTPTINGYHSSSTTKPNAGLPPQPSTEPSSPSKWAPKLPPGTQMPASIVVDNSMFDFDFKSEASSGARPKATSNMPTKKGGKSSPSKKKATSQEYFRLPLPGESVEVDSAFGFKYQDAVMSSSSMELPQAGPKLSASKEETNLGDKFLPVANPTLDAGKKVETKKPPEVVLSLQDIESSVLDDKGVNLESEKSSQSDEAQDAGPHLKLFDGQQLMFPDLEGSGSGALYSSLESESDQNKAAKMGDETEPVKYETEPVKSKEEEMAGGLPDAKFLEEIEQELRGDLLPSSLMAGTSHIMTAEDDDLISEMMDSDDDLADTIEEELSKAAAPQKPIGPPQRNLSTQRSLTENEEWDRLMKEIHASAEIHVEPIPESEHEDSLAASVDKWFSPVADASNESTKTLFPDYSLFSPWKGTEAFLDVASDDDAPMRRKSKILEKLIPSKQEDSEEDTKPTSENDNSDNAGSQRNTPHQLPVIRAELSIKAKEFIPRPAPEEPEESDDSESSNLETTTAPPKSHPITSITTVIVSSTPPTRPPFPMHGAHPQMGPYQPGFPPNPGMAPGPYAMMGPNRMPHPFPPGGMPPPQPFQGHVIRPHPMPPRPRMPMGPHPPRPVGPIPPGGPLRPVGFPPGGQPFVHGMPPRTLVPHMAGPPGPQMRMVHVPLLTGPAAGMQARFPNQGSPQHRPAGFRHPAASSPSPPLSRPNVVASPPLTRPNVAASPPTPQSAGHKPGFAGAPRWPTVRSNVVKHGKDASSTSAVAAGEVKLLPSDKNVLCLMRGVPGSGKSTLAKKLKGESGVIYSTDEFFYKNGEYEFDFDKLAEAHEWNHNRAREACEAGTSPVIIDNTNCTRWEMKPYVQIAIDNEYQVEFREPATAWRNNAMQCARKNSHGVPKENIERMLMKYEHSVTVENILKLKPSKRRGKKNSCDEKEQSTQAGERKKTKASSAEALETKDGKDERKSSSSSNEHSDSRVVEEEITAHVVELQQSAADVAAADDDDDVPAECDIETEAHVTSPSRKLQLSIPLEIFQSTNEADEKNSEDDESIEDRQHDDGDHFQDGNDSDVIIEEDIIIEDDESEDDFTKDDDDHVDKDDDEHDDGVLNDDSKDANGDTKTSQPSAADSDTADKTDISDNTKIPCVQVDISSVPFLSELQESDSSVHAAESNQIKAEPDVVEVKNETSVEEKSSSDSLQGESSVDSNKLNTGNSILNSADMLETEKASTDGVDVDTLPNLVKARQYALEVTKEQSAKYTDAPCSECTDKLDGEAVTGMGSCDGISDEHCTSEVNKLSVRHRKDDKLTYTDAEELDSGEIIIVGDHLEVRNPKTATVESGLCNESKTLNGVKDEEDDTFEDALSSNSSVTMDTSSNVSFTTPPQVSPEGVGCESRVESDKDTSESPQVPTTNSEEAKTKNQRQSPRLAAVFSEAETQSGEDTSEEKVNWVFPGFTDTKSEDNVGNGETVPAQVAECSCQTAQEEFAVLQKLESGKLSEDDVNNMGFRVVVGHINTFLHFVITQIAELSNDDKDSESSDFDDIPSVRKLDQSTMTDDVSRDRSFSTNLLTLQGCFPNVSKESLEGVLSDCFGDVEWATNILIDSGYIETTISTEPEKNSVEETGASKITECVEESDISYSVSVAVEEDHSVAESENEREQKIKLSSKDGKEKLEREISEISTFENDVQSDKVPAKEAVQDTQEHSQSETKCNLDITDSIPPLSSCIVENSLVTDNNEDEHFEQENLPATLIQESGNPTTTELLDQTDVKSGNTNDLKDSNRDKALGNLISGLIQDGLVSAVKLKSVKQNPASDNHASTEADLATEPLISDNAPLSQEESNVVAKDHLADQKLPDDKRDEVSDSTSLSDSTSKVSIERKPIANSDQDIPKLIESSVGICRTQTSDQVISLSTSLHHSTSESKLSDNAVTVPLEMIHDSASESKLSENAVTVPLQMIHNSASENKISDNAVTVPLEMIHKSASESKLSENVVTVPLELLVPASNVNAKGTYTVVSSGSPSISTHSTEASNSAALQSGLGSCLKSQSTSVVTVSSESSAVVKVNVNNLATGSPVECTQSMESLDWIEKPQTKLLKTPSSSVESSPSRLAMPKLRTPDVGSDFLQASPKRSPERHSDTDSDSCSNPLDVWGLDDGMVLQLDAAFALQLQEMFGPVGFHLTPGGMSDQDLEVKISTDVAKQLHTLWASTLQQRFDAEQKQMERMIKADEQLARKLQEEEELTHIQDQEEQRLHNQLTKNSVTTGARPKTKSKKSKPLLLQVHHNSGGSGASLAGETWQGDGAETKSWWQHLEKEDGKHLQEIMDEDLARQLTNEDAASVSSSEDTVQSLAVKIKRKQLHEKFPSMDRSLLDDIFARYEYELIPTIKDVERLLANQSPPQDVYTDEELRRLEQQQMQLAEKESLAQMIQAEDDDVEYEPPSYQSIDNPSYHDYRAEATMHYQQRQECFQKAAAAYQRGLKDLASFYSRQGHQHTDLLRAANRRASEVILEARQAVLDENVLDLHGLHIEEAVEKLEEVLKERSPPSYTSSDIPPLTPRPSHLLIITGRGKNSRGGVARIKPAIATYLKNNNYRFTIPNAGLIKVLW